MPIIKDLKNVKDEEITLLDVKRAEEIIERANRLLGRATVKEIHHWNGWGYLPTGIVPNRPSLINPDVVWCSTKANITDGTSTTYVGNGLNGSLNLNTSISDVCRSLLSD